MKIRPLLAVFSPLAFFYALSGDVSAQVVVVGPGVLAPHPSAPVLSPHAVHVPAFNGNPGFIYHPVFPGHAPCATVAPFGHYPAYPVAHGFGPYVRHHRPSVFVGPEVVLFSTGPGTTVSSVIDGGARSATARPDPDAWMDMGMPEGGPVGTWFEDAPAPDRVFQYTLHGNGTYERSEIKKSASGPATLVAKAAERTAFSFDEGKLVLDPEGTRREGPYAVRMSVNGRGETRVTLKDVAKGELRVWREAP